MSFERIEERRRRKGEDHQGYRDGFSWRVVEERRRPADRPLASFSSLLSFVFVFCFRAFFFFLFFFFDDETGQEPQDSVDCVDRGFCHLRLDLLFQHTFKPL